MGHSPHSLHHANLSAVHLDRVRFVVQREILRMPPISVHEVLGLLRVGKVQPAALPPSKDLGVAVDIPARLHANFR